MTAVPSNRLKVEKPENSFPECLLLKISGKPVSKDWLTKLGIKKPQSEVMDLFLRINFHEQWVEFKFGWVKFGLQGGELRLTLENGRMPSKLRNKELKKSLETKLTTERHLAVETENKPLIEASLGPDLTKAGLKVNLGNSQKNSRSDKFQLEIAQITHKGDDNQPVWVFENKTDEPILIGELEALLGQVLIDKIPCKVEARFVTEVHQVVTRGLKTKSGDDISNKAWLNYLELVMAKDFLNRLSKSPLSQQVLHYGE
jgi:hypothetical protein